MGAPRRSNHFSAPTLRTTGSVSGGVDSEWRRGAREGPESRIGPPVPLERVVASAVRQIIEKVDYSTAPSFLSLSHLFSL